MEKLVPRGMGFQPMNHRQDADATSVVPLVALCGFRLTIRCGVRDDSAPKHGLGESR